jgi:hypothetical protein
MGGSQTAGSVIQSERLSSCLRFDPMREVALARMWHLPDGTSCLLLKDPRSDSWELRVTRGTDILRTEHFGSPITAMDQAKRWRTVYEHAVEASN